MQPGWAPTSGLGLPLLLLARRVGLVAAVRPTFGVRVVVPCLSAALGAYVCAASVATGRLLTRVWVVCGTRVVLVAFYHPPCIFGSSCFLKREENRRRTRQHYRHRHGQLEQRCSSAMFLVVPCLAVVFPAVAPQGCGSRVIMYTGAG